MEMGALVRYYMLQRAGHNLHPEFRAKVGK